MHFQPEPLVALAAVLDAGFGEEGFGVLIDLVIFQCVKSADLEDLVRDLLSGEA